MKAEGHRDIGKWYQVDVVLSDIPQKWAYEFGGLDEGSSWTWCERGIFASSARHAADIALMPAILRFEKHYVPQEDGCNPFWYEVEQAGIRASVMETENASDYQIHGEETNIVLYEPWTKEEMDEHLKEWE